MGVVATGGVAVGLTADNSVYSRAAKESALVHSKSQKLLKCLEFCSLGVGRLT